VRDRPGLYRRDERRVVAGAGGPLAGRPTIVAALADQIELIHDRVPEFGLPEPAPVVEGETFDVAVPVAPHVPAGERVVGGDRAVRVQAQALAVERAEVLRVRAVLRLARGRLEL